MFKVSAKYRFRVALKLREKIVPVLFILNILNKNIM
jgi:hypothetical protein